MMLNRSLVLGISLALSTLPARGGAQANAPAPAAGEATPGPSDGGPPAPAALDEPSSQPGAQAAAPSSPPQKAPAQQVPAEGQVQGQVQGNAPPHETPPGQWVYTQQYGWLWMPYGDGYTHVPQDDSGQPYMYVYGPALGWSWVVAPWVWGWGPYPYYGVYGPWRFAWYGWGPRWHGSYYGYYGWRGGSGWRGGYRAPYGGYGAVRPAPVRPSYVAPPRVSGGGAAHVGRPVGGPRGGRR